MLYVTLFKENEEVVSNAELDEEVISNYIRVRAT